MRFDDEQHQRTMEFIGIHHDQIAAFARDSFMLEGRGAIQIEIPAAPVHDLVGMMDYHAVDDIREIVEELEGPARETAAQLLQMIETYDPAAQAIVTAARAGERPISIRIRLQRPLISEEPPGVH